jgi:hypothetical protein
MRSKSDFTKFSTQKVGYPTERGQMRGLAKRYSRTHGRRGSDPTRARALLAADMSASLPRDLPPHSWSNISTLRHARSNSVAPTLDADDSVVRFFESARGIGRGIERVGVRSSYLSQTWSLGARASRDGSFCRCYEHYGKANPGDGSWRSLPQES